MERKSGTATVALLVAAVLGFSFLPRTGSESGGGSAGAKSERATNTSKAKPPGPGKPEVEPACEQIVKRLKRFSDGEVPTIKVCYDKPAEYQPKPSLIRREVQFAIALLPNPIETHLPLSFDRSVEAIQQAAQDNNYIYDSSWFPWNRKEKSYSHYLDDKLADAELEDQEDQPGILVFRKGFSGPDSDALTQACRHSIHDLDCQKNITARNLDASYEGGLVVFLVGEQPTGGVSDAQFRNTLAWLGALDPSPASTRQLRILGPSFSGSLPSLAGLLDVGTLAGFPGGVTIYSGSVNSDVSVNWFRFLLERRKIDSGKKFDYKFRTFLESDSLMTNRFLCYLRHGGYHLDKVAILSEDETAFGKTSEKAPPGGLCGPGDVKIESPIYLYYPRDIATLRSAYERQGIFTAAKKQAANAPSTTLRGDLSEAPGEEHDSVRTYADQLTPLAQESVLLSIASLLQDKQAEFVIIKSTNPLDQLFISEFLRRAYPSARIVLDGADLMFRRGMEGASLRGVMLISSYPLMPWTQDAIPTLNLSNGKWQFKQTFGPKQSYRIFSEDNAEGLYIAGRQLLPQQEADSVPISDYAPPKSIIQRAATENGLPKGACSTSPDIECWWSDANKSHRLSADFERPLTWISVVGHRQFWPIAMLNSLTQENSPNPKFKMQKDHPTPEDWWDISLLRSESNLESQYGDSSSANGKPQEARRGTASIPGEMVALLMLSAGFSLLWHARLCWTGCMTGSPRARAYFAPLPKIQHPILIFISSLLLGLFALTVAGSAGIFSRDSYGFWSGTYLWGTWTAVVIIAASGMTGLIANYRLPILPSLATPRVRHIINSWKSGILWSAVWLLCIGVLGLGRYYLLTSRLSLSNEIPTLWRNVHFRSGVSAMLPQLILIAGLYVWFWFSLRGLALFGSDRPILPHLRSLPDLVFDSKSGARFESEDDARDTRAENAVQRATALGGLRDGSEMRGFRMFSQDEAGDAIERAALPLTSTQIGWFVFFLGLSLFACWASLGDPLIRTLGDRAFGSLMFGAVCFFIALILTDATQVLRTWSRLRRLLVFLDRLRLRRTVACLKGVSWQSVWSMSGNVLEERYRMLSRQMESAGNLKNELEQWRPENLEELENKEAALDQLRECEKDGLAFAKWYVDLVPGKAPDSVAPLQQYQETLAKTAGRIMGHIVLPDWRKERHSLILEPAAASAQASENKDAEDGSAGKKEEAGPRSAVEPRIRAAEEFFLLPYLAFIQNVMGRVRTVALNVLILFVAVTLAISSYPFDPLPVLGAIFLALFLMVGGVMVWVYAEMHRDATLSNITNTKPGELGMDFWLRLVTYGAGPVVALLTTLFPSITDFLVSFLQPGAEMMK